MSNETVLITGASSGIGLEIAREFAARNMAAFGSIKRLLRRPIVEDMITREKDSIREFVDIWYSEATWKQLQEIKIHS